MESRLTIMKIFPLVCCWLMLLPGARVSILAAPAEPAPAEAKPFDYMLVITGGELLEGVYPDAHTAFITRTLRPLGCRCVGSMLVDDERQDIQQALRFATNRASLVIVTGGLGPTPNDITRETLAEFTGIPLQEHPEVLAEMARRFGQPREQLRPNLLRQTLVPVRGGYLKNPSGTAVGLIFEVGAAVIVALPGPPKELQPMVTRELVPYLRQRFGVRDFGCTLTLRFVGVGQSLIDQTIKDHVSIAPDVTITSLFEGNRVDFFFTLPGNKPEDQARLKRLEDNIREHLGEYIYADDTSTLEEVVARQLQARGSSLALVEIGTGGNLAAAFNGMKGGAPWLVGAFAAPTEEALARMLMARAEAGAAGSAGADRVKDLASLAAKATRSQWAIAVGPIEPATGDAKQAELAIKYPDDRWETERVILRDSGELGRRSLVTQLLDQVRRRLR